jgi:predicted nucleotidyltransferase
MIGDVDSILTRIVPRFAEVSGVAGVVLGGSRARGTATEASDYDVGLYFCHVTPLDTRQLLKVASELVDDPAVAVVTPVGEWGPNIVGGGWLSIGGRKVDLLYREVESVASVIANCHAGRISMSYQPGHPHGFCSAIWMGEVAICRPLHDPQGVIAKLKTDASPYPEKLREALLKIFLWEVSFSVENATISIPRGDRNHIAGCAYRALCCMAQVLFALNRRYLINEKAALREAANFPWTIAHLTDRINRVWSAIGEAELVSAASGLRALDDELQIVAAAAC